MREEFILSGSDA